MQHIVTRVWCGRRASSKIVVREKYPRAVCERAVSANWLALIRTFCVSPGPSMRLQSGPVHNFFCRAEALASCAIRARSASTSTCARFAPTSQRRQKMPARQKPLIHRSFRNGREIFAQIDANAKIFCAAPRKRARDVSRAAADGGACAQNQVESLLFFSCCSNPMAVQIDSRLHLLMSPSTHG